MHARVTVLWVAVLAAAFAGRAQPRIGSCAVFPADNVWNAPVDKLPVDTNSARYVSTIGSSAPAHADFGSGLWDGGPIGIPFIEVPGTQPKVVVTFQYNSESDHGGYPVPPNAPVEGGSASSGDRHVLMIDRDKCVLYELYHAYPQPNGSWHAGSGAIFDLKSNALRPDTWTSADAAGLPIFPGLVRYDEVAAGAILHAIRFTAPDTRNTYLWPARHQASDITGLNYPPMGQRFRLKAGFDMSKYSPPVQVILRALKTYGMILADNGSSWYIGGAPDERWDNDLLHEISKLRGSDFEAVDESSLMVKPDSAQVRAAVAGPQVAAVVNAGSFLPGAISPGEILSIYGTGFSSDAKSTKVTFDNIAAPLLFASATQINVVVPYAIGSKASTSVAVTIGGAVSGAQTVAVTSAAPGIFVVLNKNYTVNSASNPAAPNSVLILYATGEGQTDPAGVDGKIANSVWPKPKLPVSVTVGGQVATVLYAGAAPGFIAGAMQINVKLPPGVANATLPLIVNIGGFTSQPGVNVAIGR